MKTRDFQYLSGMQLLKLLHDFQREPLTFEQRIVKELEERAEMEPDFVPEKPATQE
jgi:hypothetical protein